MSRRTQKPSSAAHPVVVAFQIFLVLATLLAPIPVAAGIHAHSIISVQGDGPYAQGNDGVVEYESAHIEPVDSELVVRSPHSTQGVPATIEEVRRILRLHLRKP